MTIKLEVSDRSKIYDLAYKATDLSGVLFDAARGIGQVQGARYPQVDTLDIGIRYIDVMAGMRNRLHDGIARRYHAEARGNQSAPRLSVMVNDASSDVVDFWRQYYVQCARHNFEGFAGDVSGLPMEDVWARVATVGYGLSTMGEGQAQVALEALHTSIADEGRLVIIDWGVGRQMKDAVAEAIMENPPIPLPEGRVPYVMDSGELQRAVHMAGFNIRMMIGTGTENDNVSTLILAADKR